jgi:hypothetical protein
LDCSDGSVIQIVRSSRRISLMGATRPLDRGKPLLKMSLDDYLPYEDENVMEKSWMILRIGPAILAQIANNCLLLPEREWARDRQCYARQEPEHRTGNRKPGLQLYHQALDPWRRVARARAGLVLAVVNTSRIYTRSV